MNCIGVQGVPAEGYEEPSGASIGGTPGRREQQEQRAVHDERPRNAPGAYPGFVDPFPRWGLRARYTKLERDRQPDVTESPEHQEHPASALREPAPPRAFGGSPPP